MEPITLNLLKFQVIGEEPKAEIPGYRFVGIVETKKLPNGDTEHVYEKVTTSYVDEKWGSNPR